MMVQDTGTCITVAGVVANQATYRQLQFGPGAIEKMRDAIRRKVVEILTK